MKIITWNCNGAFRKKFESLLKYQADIHVIQECENPVYSNDNAYQKFSENHIWIGDSKNKGIGIFAKSDLVLQQLDWSNNYKDHSVKHFLPCSVNNQFDLLAVWTHRNNSPNFGYIGQFWKYLQVNKANLNNAIIAGDFNSNTIWDEWDRWWNHSNVVEELKYLGIESLYHKHKDEKHGEEKTSTFYLNRNIQRPYHIDYCFASNQFTEKLEYVELEPFESWKHLSDHLPMVINFLPF